MKQIIIAQVISELGDGGVESFLINLYKNINYKKYKFLFIVQNEKRNYENDIKKYGGEIIQIQPLKKVGIIKYVNNLKDIFLKYNVDVVHCHNLTQNPFILYSAKKTGIEKRICHSHLTTAFSTKAKIAMPAIRTAINSLSTTKLSCGKEAGLFLYGKSKFEILNNTIDTKRFLIEQHGHHRENKYTVLNIARLDKQKNHTFLLKIANELKDENDIQFVCCGTGLLEDEIKTKISSLGLNSKVLLLGSRKDIPEIIQKSDILILPSLYEGLPIVSIESQISGKKILVSSNIDRNCDLGLGLVDFYDINDAKKWAEIILYYKNYGYHTPSVKERLLALKKNGYDAKENALRYERIINNEKN